MKIVISFYVSYCKETYICRSINNQNSEIMKAKMNYDKSRVFKLAHKYLRAIPMNERTDDTWSELVTMAWSVEKNGIAKPTFNEIYVKYYSKILTHVKLRNNNYNNEIAEDITQDIFIKIYQKLPSYDVIKGALSTWIYTVANNTIKDYYRKDKSNLIDHVDGYVNDEGKESFEFTSDLYTQGIEEKELYNSIEEAMQTLNSKESDIAQLYFMQDLPYNEIAEMLDVPMGTVKGLINRIRTKLKSKLQTEYNQMYS